MQLNSLYLTTNIIELCHAFFTKSSFDVMFLPLQILVVLLALPFACSTLNNSQEIGLIVFKNRKINCSKCSDISLKVHLHEIFCLNWFGQKKPSELLINHIQYFRFCLRICRDIRIFLHSAYYQNTEIFLPCIIRIRKFSFHLLSVYIQFHSAYYLQTLSFS